MKYTQKRGELSVKMGVKKFGKNQCVKMVLFSAVFGFWRFDSFWGQNWVPRVGAEVRKLGLVQPFQGGGVPVKEECPGLPSW